MNPGPLATPISRYFVEAAVGKTVANVVMPFALFANSLVAKVRTPKLALLIEYASKLYTNYGYVQIIHCQALANFSWKAHFS